MSVRRFRHECLRCDDFCDDSGSAALPSGDRKFRSGKDSPRDFLERCLAALDAWEPRIGAFVTLNVAAARADADRSSARWRGGNPLSPIDGMPLGIKDIIETADMPTENGSPLFAGFRSERDAASVAALREAGGVILGKTVTTEFAATEPRGTRNPWDPARTPGGSSSGSAAAVGAGVIPVGLGTQVIGSILRPASFCGCFGFKPTIGAVNRGGSYDGLSQSAHGTLAASLEDAWQVAYEIVKRCGGDPGFPGLYGPPHPPAPIKPRQLALLETDGWADASPGARQAVEEALSRLTQAGIAIATRYDHAEIAAAETAVHDARDLSFDINAWESRWPINTYSRRDASKLSQAMRDRLVQAEGMTLDNYRAILKERADSPRHLCGARAASSMPALRSRQPAPRRSASDRPATRCSWCRPRCSASPRSRCRCCRMAACRSACSSWALPTRTPRCSPAPLACSRC